MAVLRTPRFAQAVAACLAGAGACVVAFALAGPTPLPPPDPLDSLPSDVVAQMDEACIGQAAEAMTSTSTTDQVSPRLRPQCTRIALVSAPGESSTQLATRLADYYRSRGYEFEEITAGEAREYQGTHPQCRTKLSIASPMMPSTAVALSTLSMLQAYRGAPDPLAPPQDPSAPPVGTDDGGANVLMTVQQPRQVAPKEC